MRIPTPTLFLIIAIVMASPLHALLVDIDGSTDGGGSPSQGPTIATGVSFLDTTDRDGTGPVSDTYSDAFGAGLDLIVTVEVDDSFSGLNDGARWRDQGPIASGPGQSLSDLLRDGVGQRREFDTLTLTLNLPVATQYQITMYHHRDNEDNADLVSADIDFGNDAIFEYGTAAGPSDGLLFSNVNSGSVTTSVNTFTMTSPGDYEILIKSEDVGNSYYPLNGFEITVIPEPSTFILVGVALGSVVFLRKRR